MGEKHYRKYRQTSKRLLTVVYILFAVPLFAQNMNIEEFTIHCEPMQIMQNDILTITLKVSPEKIGEDAFFSVSNSENVLEFIQGTKTHNGKILVIKNQYRVIQNHAGNIVLTPYIKKNNGQIINLSQLEITLLYRPISNETLFEWDICEIENPQMKKTYITQGEPSLLQLYGLFSNNPQGDTIYALNIKPVKTALFKKKHHYGFSAVSPLQRTLLAEFVWTPLFSGLVDLPIADILIKGKTNYVIQSTLKSVFVHSVDSPLQSNSESFSPGIRNAFIDSTEKQDGRIRIPVTDDKHVIAAKKIASLRKLEIKRFFVYSFRKERMVLEKSLGIKKSFFSFSISHAYLFFVAAILFFIPASVLLVLKLSKKNNLSFSILICALLALVFFAAGTYTAVQSQKKMAVCTCKKTNVHTIPEINGSILASLNIGETVLVKKETHAWLFVRRHDGTTGWIQKEHTDIIQPVLHIQFHF